MGYQHSYLTALWLVFDSYALLKVTEPVNYKKGHYFILGWMSEEHIAFLVL